MDWKYSRKGQFCVHKLVCLKVKVVNNKKPIFYGHADRKRGGVNLYGEPDRKLSMFLFDDFPKEKGEKML